MVIREIKIACGKTLKVLPFTECMGLYSAQIQIENEEGDSDSDGFFDFTYISQIDELIEALQQIKDTKRY